jgi:hypothetical protein
LNKTAAAMDKIKKTTNLNIPDNSKFSLFLINDQKEGLIVNAAKKHNTAVLFDGFSIEPTLRNKENRLSNHPTINPIPIDLTGLFVEFAIYPLFQIVIILSMVNQEEELNLKLRLNLENLNFMRIFSFKKIGCPREDLNLHAFRHTNLNRACIPFHHLGLSSYILHV